MNLREAQADWLTATSSDEHVRSAMADLWWLLKDHAHITPAFVRKSAWQGYMGERTEHGFYGMRNDGDCVVLGGPLAAHYARQFLEVGARASRLDIQVTGVLGEPPGRMIEHMFNSARGFKPAGRPAPDLKMFVGRDGPEGLYVGRRSSQVMLRIYDKGKESRQKAYAGCLRIELEAKAETARKVSGILLEEPDESAIIPDMLRSLCIERGVPFPFETGGRDVVLRKTRYISTQEARMAWLMKQVSPTVQALADEVGTSKVLSVLFPDSLDKHQHDDIIDGEPS